MSDYLEPWTAHKGVLMSIVKKEGVPQAKNVRFFGCFDTAIYPKDYAELEEELGEDCPDDLDYALAERAAACVNALEGYNPAGIGPVVSALQDLLTDNEQLKEPFRNEALCEAAREALKLL